MLIATVVLAVLCESSNYSCSMDGDNLTCYSADEGGQSASKTKDFVPETPPLETEGLSPEVSLFETPKHRKRRRIQVSN